MSVFSNQIISRQLLTRLSTCSAAISAHRGLASGSNETDLVPTVFRKNRIRRRKPIARIDDRDLDGYLIAEPKPSLLERRGEVKISKYRQWKPEDTNYITWFSYLHGDWDFRKVALKRWKQSIMAEIEVNNQVYNSKRNNVLGNDLAAAHFVVYRKGKVKFLGQNDWITEYRSDAKGKDVDEDDLPTMSFDLCTMPVVYDPAWRLEAMDCKGLPLVYEGLLNLQHLNYLRWLSLRECPKIDDWCLDRLSRIFQDNLEYLDISGCSKISDRGIGTLHRCKNLKTLVVENMSHIQHLEIVCALLEDHLPELQVIGVDYEKRKQELIAEGEEIAKQIELERKKLEDNTIIGEATPVTDFNQSPSKDRDTSYNNSNRNLQSESIKS